MKTTKFASHSHPALAQLHKNACLWIGHMNVGSADHFAGQTFQCPGDGALDSIQVYSIAVSRPGKVILTLHTFDKKTKSWGPVLSSSEIEVNKNDVESWMEFQLPAVELHKDNTYGFRLKSPDTLVALGEAAWPSKSPFAYGEEWNINNIDNKDHYYRYFSLAFKVELRA
ncbi:MAG: hypothetical protein EPN92_03970 [Chitinophagaceae bacterium]|nr:MAG: hypothetical protein EPN92_03970 [Chitinophagaceae bacterium]